MTRIPHEEALKQMDVEDWLVIQHPVFRGTLPWSVKLVRKMNKMIEYEIPPGQAKDRDLDRSRRRYPDSVLAVCPDQETADKIAKALYDDEKQREAENKAWAEQRAELRRNARKAIMGKYELERG